MQDHASRDETEVRKLIEDWAAAVRNRDVAGILRHHANDLRVFDVPPPFESKGIDAYRDTWRQFFSWACEPARFEIVEMDVTAGADVAFAVATMRCAGPNKTGEDVVLDFRLTIGLRKIDGQWTIVHEHHSVPAED
ncbi:MAG TPA: SgcJ/EcaC family oxidoreductase [Polyangiaceae bacterium]|jgi:uncharacterized protein (TIGR02246 family)